MPLSPSNKCKLLLEMVPPTHSEGMAGLTKRLTEIRQIQAAIPIHAINIPEIHPESAHGKGGERNKPFEERMSPREFSRHIHNATGLDCIVNHVVVHQPCAALEEWLTKSQQSFGIDQVVLVGGERHTIQYPGPGVCEANRIAKSLGHNPPLTVGNICIPGRRDEALRIARKLNAGADFFTTQVIYEADDMIQLVQQLANQDTDIRNADFYLSVCPVQSERNIQFLQWLGVHISSNTEAKLLEDKRHILQTSIDHIEAMWKRLLDAQTQLIQPLNLHLNLCPIGNIQIDTSIQLGRTLLACM